MKNLGEKIKNLFSNIKKFVIKYSKYLLPVAVLIIAAAVVLIALDQRQKSIERENERLAQAAEAEKLAAQEEIENTEIPLEETNDDKIKALFESFYAALSAGDTDALLGLCDVIDDSELIRLTEQSAYVDYTLNNVYIQAGPKEGSYITYTYYMAVFERYPDVALPALKGYLVDVNAEGELYIVMRDLTDEENDYITQIASHDDVRELSNKVNVEYNDLVLEHPDILDYFIELDTTVSTAVGEKIAQLNDKKQAEAAASQAELDAESQENAEDGEGETVEEAEPVIMYATATTRVNIRASDSANAERVGEAMTGDKFQVVEELLNGWTKIIYNDSEAYIKSEYLSMIQSSDGQPTIGMLTAKSEVNIRSLPDTASERVGALMAGDQLEIVSIADGWCCVKFEGTLAYVAEEFVDCTLFE
ncbi:MAG: SH3 domain-containing protein [Lachnospiraceae bacterium]|nr:SH3 domain-containing protein [Lachnospiraceae bacterium]